jgi:predicted DNA-binding protein with PD1-like motif
MKTILKDGRRYILRFDKGEEVLSKLGEFLQSEQIGACTFSAVGAVIDLEMGFFNVHVKDYRKKIFLEEFEMVSLNGNGSIVEGKPFIHAHGMFGRNDFTTVGGHVFKLTVSVTCEMFLIKLDGQISRTNNEEFNLKLLE